MKYGDWSNILTRYHETTNPQRISFQKDMKQGKQRESYNPVTIISEEFLVMSLFYA
jgi:hypothetical protein